jgi:hypothetical protein
MTKNTTSFKKAKRCIAQSAQKEQEGLMLHANQLDGQVSGELDIKTQERQ